MEKISFYDFTVVAKETDLTVDDVPEKEVFDLTDLKEFKVTLRNWHGNVVDFAEYVKNRKLRSESGLYKKHHYPFRFTIIWGWIMISLFYGFLQFQLISLCK